MTLPKNVYIGPFDYRVKVTKSKHFDVLGETDNDGSFIYLKAKQSESQRRDTLVHEVLHAMIFTSGYGKTAALSHDEEENLVVTLSPWLTQFLRDNPEAVSYLQAD